MEYVVRMVDKEDPKRDRAEWLARPASERIAAVETLRRTCYSIAGLDPDRRLEKEISLRSPLEHPA